VARERIGLPVTGSTSLYCTPKDLLRKSGPKNHGDNLFLPVKPQQQGGVLANRGHVLHSPEALRRVDLGLLADGLVATLPRAPRPATSLCQTATAYAKPVLRRVATP
jgi:hypothetical protein